MRRILIFIVLILSISAASNSEMIYKMSKKKNSLKLIENFMKGLDYYTRAIEILLISNPKFVGSSLMDSTPKKLKMSNNFKTFSSYDMEGYKLPSSSSERGVDIMYSPTSMLIGAFNLINWNYVNKNEIQLEYMQKYVRNPKYPLGVFSSFGLRKELPTSPDTFGNSNIVMVSSLSTELQKGKLLEGNSSVFKIFYFLNYMNYVKPTTVATAEIQDAGKSIIQWKTEDSNSVTLTTSVEKIVVNTILPNEFLKAEVRLKPDLQEEDLTLIPNIIIPNNYIFKVVKSNEASLSMIDTALDNYKKNTIVDINSREDTASLKGYDSTSKLTGLIPSNRFPGSHKVLLLK